MRRAAPILLLLLLLLSAPGAADEPPIRLFAVEPFAMDLWPDAAPAGAAAADSGHPIRIRAAPGIEISTVVGVAAAGAVPRLEVRAGALRSGEREIGEDRVRLEVIRSVRRDIPAYSRFAAERYPGRYRGGILQPDILVSDEPAFGKAAGRWRNGLPDAEPRATAVLGPMRPGTRKYLLLTVAVPADAAPGSWEGSVRAGEASAPVSLAVDPIALDPPRGLTLSIGNEFARDAEDLFEPSLALLARVGMNTTRIAEITSLPDPLLTLDLLGEHGMTTVVQIRPPRDAAAVKRIGAGLDLWFYGRDEPQPKDPERSDFREMAEHVRLSAKIHALGGRVATSIHYPFALALREKRSRVYRELQALGVEGAVEPLDWASYGLGLLRPPKERRTPEGYGGLLAYVGKLQKEFDRADWSGEAVALESKHSWRETYYWPQGLIRDPFYARLLFGFHLFRSHLDGAMAWTLYRTHGLSPLADGREPVATLAIPGETMLHPTYCLEACREGVTDLRYAQAARRAVGRLLASGDRAEQRRGRKLRKRFLELIDRWRDLAPKGSRIDLAIPAPERALRETRDGLADLILEAR